MTTAETKIVRALNYARREHFATYIGLRSLVELSDESAVERLGDIVDHLAKTDYKFTFRQHYRFKKLGAAKKIEYRTFQMLDPISSLIESYLLSSLMNDGAFARELGPSYSYLLTTNRNAGHFFRPFMAGYSARNDAIKSRLDDDEDNVAIVCDIKNFYPSIDQRQLREVFNLRLARSDQSQEAKSSLRRAVDLLLEEAGPKGLPVGPALSHVLADLSLEQFDKTLAGHERIAYFRYVDDLVVVCKRDHKEEFLRIIEDELNKAGLVLNKEKTDFVPSGRWKASSKSQPDGSSVDFQSFVKDLEIYLAIWEDEAERLGKILMDEGFNLPFDRIRSKAQYPRFRKILARGASRLGVALYGVPNEAGLIDQAHALRKHFLAKAEMLNRQTIPADGMPRRWFVQEARFVFNRLIYLLPPSRYDDFARLMPQIDELHETAVTISALANENLESLFELPGSPIRAFGEIGRSREIKVNQEAVRGIILQSEFTERQSDVLISLSAFIDMDFIPLNELRTSPVEREILSAFTVKPPAKRELFDLGYADQLISCMLNRKKSEIQEFAISRWSPAETITLDALTLGSSYYYL